MFRNSNEDRNFTTLQILKLIMKDIFHVMPMLMTAIMLLQLVIVFMNVGIIYSTSKIIDSALASLSMNDKFQTTIYWMLKLFICHAVTIVCEKVIFKLKNIDVTYKTELFHNKLADFNETLSLEAADIPSISDMFWKAKDALYQDRMLQVIESGYNIFLNSIKILSISTLLASYHLGFIFLAIISVIPTYIVQIIYNKKLYILRNKQIKRVRRRDYLWQLLTKKESIREMQTLGFEEYITELNYKLRSELFVEENLLRKSGNKLNLICNLCKSFFYMISIGFSIILLVNSKITIGAFSACISAFLSLQNATQNIVYSFTSLHENCKYANDYYQFFYLQTDNYNGNVRLCGDIESIILNNVSYSYPNRDDLALDNINFRIHKGERVILVGENGSGKTTLTKVLAGLYKPASGDLLYNNINFEELHIQSIYEKISIVTQNFMKYSMTLRQNIGISNMKEINNDSKINNIVALLGLENVVDKLGGVDTELGLEFGGAEISGGEWQKVAIARAMFKDNNFMILDEPTSALDPLIEYNLLKSFLEITKDKTSIIVSHRVGLCRFADRIIVMKKGKIVEEGTHEELLQRNGEYALIWGKQAKWYKDII